MREEGMKIWREKDEGARGRYRGKKMREGGRQEDME